jgi:hypothetical protein
VKSRIGIRIRMSVKSWIWMRIKVMRIRNPGKIVFLYFWANPDFEAG